MLLQQWGQGWGQFWVQIGKRRYIHVMSYLYYWSKYGFRRAWPFGKGLTQSLENTRKVRKIIYVLSIKWMHLYLIGKGGIFSVRVSCDYRSSRVKQGKATSQCFFEKIFLLKCAMQSSMSLLPVHIFYEGATLTVEPLEQSLEIKHILDSNSCYFV